MEAMQKLENIHDDYTGYKKIIDFYYSNKDKYWENIDINLDGWFSGNVCSILGAVLYRLQENVNDIKLIAGKPKNTLERNGFLSFYGYKSISDDYQTTIPYRRFSIKDERSFNDYVFKELLNKSFFPQMSKILKKKIAESIYEIFVNAVMHSQTEEIFTCGQYFRTKNTINFMITDLGIGIREVINNTFGKNLTAIQAIKWALVDGNTTKKGVSGGLGLAILLEFIKLNDGIIQIISNDGFFEYKSSGEITKTFENEFNGTAINISINANNNVAYSLNNISVDDIF